jgi:hypothetical protein
MKKIIFIVLIYLFGCEYKDIHYDLAVLCSYQNKSGAVSTKACISSEFIVQLSNVQGKVFYNNTLKSYCIVTSVDRTYDCELIGVLCDDYSAIEGKTVVYSAKFYSYQGSFKPPIGGQKVFVLNNFTYSIK